MNDTGMNTSTFTEAFIKKLPRENSGSNTSNAYDFQKDWALCLLLERHNTADDYLIVLDYHDDIVVFDSEQSATTADFYQVKTSGKQRWTQRDLTSREQGPDKLSIIGKIYENLHKFACQTNSLNFVSNIPYGFSLQCSERAAMYRDVVRADELSQSAKDAFLKAITEEHGEPDERFCRITFFHVTDLSVWSHPDQTIGKLAKFLDERFPGKKSKPVPIYQALFSEISRKTDYGKDLSNYLDCLKKKAIGKSYFDNILKSVAVRRDFVELWRTIENTLIAEGLDAVEIRLIRNAWDRLEIDLLDASNFQLQRLYKAVKKETTALCCDRQIRTLRGILERMRELMKERFSSAAYPYEDTYTTALILAAFYEE